MADYYVSPAGSDTANGSIATPFLTPIKGLNTVQAGDRLILREGVYKGSNAWFPPRATADKPISIEAFPGEQATFTALSKITGWQPFDLTDGKAIYRAPMPFTMCGVNSAVAGEDFVTCNGIPVNEAQWPAANPAHYPQKSIGWATVDGGAWLTNPSTTNAFVNVQIQDASLTSFSDNSLVGSRITLLPGARWTLVSGTVSANIGDKLTFSIKSPGGSSYYSPDNRSLYFLFGKKIFLSTPGSWWRDPDTNYLYLWLTDSSNPNNSIIEAKKEAVILDFYARSHYKFLNLTFLGNSLNTYNASNLRFDGCTFKWYSHRLYLDTAWGWVNSALYINRDQIQINDCNFVDSFGTITAFDTQQGLIIQNCVISNTGGVTFVGSNSKFLQNTVDTCPGGCFKLGGTVSGTEVAYNRFERSGATFTDGGIFLSDRTCVGPARIHRNFLHDGSAPLDATREYYGTAGFYFEHDIYDLTFDHNIISQTTSPGFNLVANGQNAKLVNLHFYNNTCDATLYWVPSWAGNPTYPGTRFLNNYFNAQAANTGYHSDIQFLRNAFKVLPGFLGNTTNIAATNPGFDTAYQLAGNSPLKSIAQQIPGITTDPFPDIGAREGVAWTPGAIIRAIDVPLLAINTYQAVGSQVVFTIANIPFGRHLGDNFKMKLGNGAEVFGTIAPYSKTVGRTVWARVDGNPWVAIGQIESPPILQSLSSGAGLPGIMLSLFGDNYQQNSVVWFGDRPLPTSYIDIDSLGVTIPGDSEIGSLQLKVVNADGQTSDALNFFVLSSLTLAASSATVVSPGSQIILTGTGFVAGAIARFGADTEVSTDFTNNTAIGVQIPDLSAGPIALTVINPDAVESESLNLTIVLLPTIASFSPNPIRPGQELTVTGGRFGADPYLLIAEFEVIPVAATDTSLVAVIPTEIPAGGLQIRVVSQEVGASNFVNLTVERPPVLVATIPPSAPPGVQIELTGSDLAADGQIFFGDTAGLAPLFSGLTASVIVPSVAIGVTALKVVSAQGLESAEIQFEVLPLPTISALSPIAAPAGNSISIVGETFAAGVRVFFAGVEVLAGASRISDTEIGMVVPSRSPGMYTIRVENPNGGVSASISFLVQGRPTIASISTLKALPGTVVSVSGAHFEAGVEVRFKDVLLSAQVLGTTGLSFLVPTIAPESLELSIRNLTGLESDPISFEVLAVPIISSIVPASAIAGEEISVSGAHFKPDIKLYLDDQQVTTVVRESPTTLKFEVPAQVAGTLSLRVLNVIDNLGSQSINFTIFKKPAISTVAPVAAQPGSSIRISGINFEDPTVLLGGGAISFNQSGGFLTFILPQYPSGTILPIRIRNSSNVLSEPSSLMVLPPIALNSISPPTSAPKTVIELQGSFFPADARIFFGSVEAQVLSVSDNLISVRVPSLPAIPTAIQVRTPAGAVSETIIPFDVLPTLAISQILPNSAPSGTEIQIEGSGFNEGVLVFVRSVLAINLVRVSDSILKLKVPQLSPGPAQVRVVLPDDRQVIFAFAVPTVWISGVSHTIVQVGEWLEITGTGFVQPITVTVGGVAATEIIVISTTLLKARVPPLLINNI